MIETRRSWYWDDYSDADLAHLLKSHQANIEHHEYEINRITQELTNREEYDANISRL